MSKTYVEDAQRAPQSQIGATLDALAGAIEARREAGPESYTYELLNAQLETLCKKVSEESLEAAMAAKEAQMLDVYSEYDNLYDAAVDHLRYEAADVVYHLAVLLARFNIGMDEFAAELNMRMTEDERPQGAVMLHEQFVRRGK